MNRISLAQGNSMSSFVYDDRKSFDLSDLRMPGRSTIFSDAGYQTLLSTKNIQSNSNFLKAHGVELTNCYASFDIDSHSELFKKRVRYTRKRGKSNTISRPVRITGKMKYAK